METITATAEKFDDLRVARPLLCTQPLEASFEFLDFLGWSFESKVCSFPGICRSAIILGWRA